MYLLFSKGLLDELVDFTFYERLFDFQIRRGLVIYLKFLHTGSSNFQSKADSFPNSERVTTQSQLLMTLKMKPFENIMGKRENAGNQQYLLFPQYFQPFPK